MYTPNEEERSARAAKDNAEAKKIDAEANKIKDGMRWSKAKLGCVYAIATLTVFALGFIVGKFL